MQLLSADALGRVENLKKRKRKRDLQNVSPFNYSCSDRVTFYQYLTFIRCDTEQQKRDFATRILHSSFLESLTLDDLLGSETRPFLDLKQLLLERIFVEPFWAEPRFHPFHKWFQQQYDILKTVVKSSGSRFAAALECLNDSLGPDMTRIIVSFMTWRSGKDILLQFSDEDPPLVFKGQTPYETSILFLSPKK